MTREQTAKLRELVLAFVRRGPVACAAIVQGVAGDMHDPAGPMSKLERENACRRPVDRALQRLREDGRITFDRPHRRWIAR